MSGRDTQGFNRPAIEETHAFKRTLVSEQILKQESDQRSEGQVGIASSHS